MSAEELASLLSHRLQLEGGITADALEWAVSGNESTAALLAWICDNISEQHHFLAEEELAAYVPTFIVLVATLVV